MKQKQDKIVKWLQDEQQSLLNRYRNKIGKINGNDWGGVWITAMCRCGNDFRTVFHISANGKCNKCGKRFYRVKS